MILEKFIVFFDYLAHTWEKRGTQRTLGLLLFLIYLVSLCAIGLNNAGLYPAILLDKLPHPPHSHFASIHLAFTLILIMELVSLIFIIPSSISTAIAKQFEILTLILLRNAFKELTALEEPVRISMENIDSLTTIIVSALGAVAVFLCLGIYRRIACKKHFIIDHEERRHYIMAKKVIAFVLLILFIIVGVDDLLADQTTLSKSFFETIYTILIFADIAVVLVSQCYMTGYYAVFRNSGFVMGTLLMRLSLSAPPLWSPAIGLVAALFVILLTWETNRYIEFTEKQ
ncbi:MAG: hypothetical protein IJU76_12365 [Desulfovibrionaceae bacterium]|nr:hypothetical protein [Desulfovibrionaceae bacterium]